MKRKIRLFGILLIVTTLIIMQLPVSEADAAISASDFKMEGTTLVKYRGTEESVSVPDTVEVIGEGAFEGNDKVELVVLPKSVTKIEPYAFWNCENLETVVLNTGMTEVGDYAFANCTGLKKMSIPDNIKSIGVQAFMDCVKLTDITIAPEVLYIHETSFDGCYRLTIHCDKGSAADKYAESFYERQKEMPEYEDVGNYDSEDEEISEAPIPDTPETIPGTMLGDTKVVGNQAFVFINNTNQEVLSGNAQGAMESETIDTEGSNGNLPKFAIVDHKIVADQAYYKNNSLQEVMLPEGIEEVGQFAFARSTVTRVDMPETVKSIGYGAFYHCDGLTDVNLPNSIENVEPEAFTHTAWVGAFRDESGEDFLISGGVLVAYKGRQEKVVVPDGVRVIAAEAFKEHMEIKEVVLPDSLLTVGEGAFEGCSKLSVVVPGKGVRRIKDRAFAGSALYKITLPRSVEEIGIGAFEKTVQLSYEGEIPQTTHELSAERLSNEAYRGIVEASGEAAKVQVVGLADVTAKLEGADRGYTLSITEASDRTSMEAAYERCLLSQLSPSAKVYELLFTDSSEVPITRLGKQQLQINIPVSKEWNIRNLAVYSTDRNGQLEQVDTEIVQIEKIKYLRLELSYVSQIAIVER